jgi:chemotaxis protein methyltransferase CheR
MAQDSEAEAIEVRLLLEAILARYGYDLRDYAPASLHRRVLAALARTGLPHLGELQHRLLGDPDLMTTVLSTLTVSVSDMFRDPSFYLAFRSQVAPILHTYPLLRIWHCGCANGEEVYANAILLAEEGLYERAQIYATDLSPNALERAQQGIFPASSLPTYAENYAASGGRAEFSSYYTQAYDGIAMKEWLRKNILFFQHDLVGDHVFGEMHVVFCRNVLIYFTPALRERVIGKFALCIGPNGFLCLGRTERLPSTALAGPFGEFEPEERIYRRSYRPDTMFPTK